MRPALAAAFVALIAIATSLPAEAAPFPQTREAARGLVEDTLADADGTAAGALREARLLVSDLRAIALRNGALDVRATLVQPVVHGSGDFLSVLWAAGDARGWTGAYWLETSAGATTPNAITLGSEGDLFFLRERPLGPLDSVDITYHFLGVDGKHTVVPMGRADILAFEPELDHADFGGASSARAQGKLVGLFVTPWNLLGRDATLGVTVTHENGSTAESPMQSCADPGSNVVEAGCRWLYLIGIGPDPLAATLWHLDDQGERVADRTLTIAELDAGYTFAP